jgi:hypothetical protein
MEKKLVILILFCIFNSVAQTSNPHYFFPHHIGDVFEYQYYRSTTWFQNIITSDSLYSDGRYRTNTSYFGAYIVDTANHEIKDGSGAVLLKVNADSGDTWIAGRYGRSGANKAKVIFVYPTRLFNEDVIVKVIDYTDSSSGLFYQELSFSSKFGIISEAEDLGVDYNLRGARINGVVYGMVTLGVDKYNNHQNNFILNQNYPNPFNPTTNISFTLPQRSFVSLKVFDLLGREVTTIISEEMLAGSYAKQWNAANIPSGIYFYRLQAGLYSETKKLILFK